MKDTHHREQQQQFFICESCGLYSVVWVRVSKSGTKLGQLVSICANCRKIRAAKRRASNGGRHVE